MKLKHLWIRLLALALFAQLRAFSAGTISFVLGSDTALWNFPGGINIYVHTNHFSTDLYTDPTNHAYQVMDPAWRAKFADSYGNPLKLTWWMLVGSVYGQSDNLDAPVPNLLPLYLMRHYHGAALRDFGDELTLHYHTFLWSDYSGDGTHYWNQAKTFRECRGDFDRALAESLIEEETFTVTFRSGWHYMDNEWQTYIDRLWPYNMDDDSPLKSGQTVQPFFNVLDWSQAPTNFVPFHPATTNYQLPGAESAWNVRSVKTISVTQPLVDDIFAQAADGTDEVVSFWAHLPESFFVSDMERMDTLIHAAAAKYPDVKFRYCSAVEAMQRWRGLTGQQPPTLTVKPTETGGLGTLEITTSGPIYQEAPFVGFKDVSENYGIAICVPAGSNRWTALLPLPPASLAKAGVAVTDPAGNLAIKIVRWVPDDLYLDNLSPGYFEPSGTWTNTASAAWGVDARESHPAPSETATAQWLLPVTEARSYAVLAQLPRRTDAAPAVWQIWAGSSNVLSRSFPQGTPTGWVRLGEAWLDPAQTNRVVLLGTSAPGQTNTLAADVIRVTPLAQTPDPVAGGVQVDATPGATTVNLLWTTTAPCPTAVDYGEGLQYGQSSVPVGTPTFRHVATLAVPGPGALVQYRIRSGNGGRVATRVGEFTVPPLPQPVASELVSLTNTWRYSTNDLDGTPWPTPGFADAAWPVGQGLLWADARSGAPNPDLQPIGSQLPVNPATGLPFPTYYFRTWFDFTGDRPDVRLLFTNYIDDGAVFYLNGSEIYRNNLPAAPETIRHATLATGFNCDGDATCPIIFSLAGEGLTNLLTGRNLLAVEVHNYSADSPDLTLGSSLTLLVPPTLQPHLNLLMEPGGGTTLYWNSDGYTLETSTDLKDGGAWQPAPGAIGSPYFCPDSAVRFYRLKD